MIYVDVRILHKRFPGKYDHIESGRVPVTREDLQLTPRATALSRGGAGSQLKKMLAWFGMKPSKGCRCERRASHMDRMGCDWCEQNAKTIVGWLQEEHTRQKILLPFVPMAAEQLVRLAIRRARKEGNR
jgi:hypothetical protein